MVPSWPLLGEPKPTAKVRIFSYMEEKNSRCYSWVNNGLIVGGLWLLGVFLFLCWKKVVFLQPKKTIKK